MTVEYKLFERDMEAFTEAFAEFVTKSGKAEAVTAEYVRERVLHYMEVAKKELLACGPEESNDASKFCPTATIIGPIPILEGNVRVGFNGDAEKHAMMHALSDTCKSLLAQVVIIRMVGTCVRVERIAKAMGVNLPDRRDRQKHDYFTERAFRWIKQNYGRPRFGALPQEYRDDFIVVSAMGPRIPEIGASVMYKWENGTLTFGEECNSDHFQMHLEMIPRWWQ